MADHVDFMADLCCFDVFTRGRFLTSEQSAFQEHSLTYGERKETRGQSLLIFFWISGCTTYYGKKKKKREKKKERKSGIWIICPLWISKCLPYHLSVFQFPWLEGHLWWWRVKIKYQSLVARAWVCFPHQVSLKIIKLNRRWFLWSCFSNWPVLFIIIVKKRGSQMRHQLIHSSDWAIMHIKYRVHDITETLYLAIKVIFFVCKTWI